MGLDSAVSVINKFPPHPPLGRSPILFYNAVCTFVALFGRIIARLEELFPFPPLSYQPFVKCPIPSETQHAPFTSPLLRTFKQGTIALVVHFSGARGPLRACGERKPLRRGNRVWRRRLVTKL